MCSKIGSQRLYHKLQSSRGIFHTIFKMMLKICLLCCLLGSIFVSAQSTIDELKAKINQTIDEAVKNVEQAINTKERYLGGYGSTLVSRDVDDLHAMKRGDFWRDLGNIAKKIHLVSALCKPGVGFTKWKKHERLKEHEERVHHRQAFLKWKLEEERLKAEPDELSHMLHVHILKNLQ
ncbi:hypothetical protein Btru_064366 [Bulinus truncatus]|nr:hypothetical protein Btru_064366 [Bulinus truncatus]